MKILLPVLKTKLFILSFVSACTVILATTVPQIKNFIAPEKAIGEKITTEQKKITPKIKKQNRTVSSSRVTSGLSLDVNNSFVATVTTDKLDYQPGEYVIITGSGWTPGETVTLHFDETPVPATCLLSHDLTAVADANGDIYNNQFLVKENHLGVHFILTATGLSSGFVAVTEFDDDADITVAGTATLPVSLSISADKAGNATAPAYTTFGGTGNVIVREGNGTQGKNDFSTNFTQIVLTAPSDWEFKTSGVTVTKSSGADMGTVSISSVTATTITISV